MFLQSKFSFSEIVKNGVGPLCFIFCLISLALPAAAQGKADSAKVKVLVAGTFHFHGAPDYNSIMAPEQQKEIGILVDSLLRFKPDKVALEFERKDSARVDSLYQTYKYRSHVLTANERQQLGFRIAKKLNHRRVYPVDYKKPWGMDTVMTWAKKNQPGFLDYFREWKRENNRIDSVLHHSKTIPEIIQYMNSPEFLNRLQEARMTYMSVGAGENYIGTKPLASVYERNMRIVANLLDVAEPGDRILVIYGSGHTYFFHRFIEQHPAMELVPLNEYL